MKVFSVTGITGTGKTSVVEGLIREFRSRGYSVGSVKEIHNENFRIDTEGKNTWRHRQAGAGTVTALGYHETDVMYSGKMDIYDVLRRYHEDIIALEGVSDAVVPNIACCAEDGLPDITPLTIAVSGRFANTHKGKYEGLPIYNIMTDAAELADLLIEKMPELMQDIDPACCGLCGYDCRTFLSKCLKGQDTINQCVLRRSRMSLKMDGKKIVMVPFVENVLRNVISGVVRELRGYKKGGKIEIEFCDQAETVFESRRNRAALSDGVVVKELSDPAACDNEERILKLLNGRYAPRLKARKGNTLYIEYIEGALLVDVYLSADAARAQKLAGALASAVKEIYRITGSIMGDENFRNYIVREDEVCRVDFEEAADGTLTEWCAKLSAFASLYDAGENTKIAFIGALVHALGIREQVFEKEYERELRFLSDRWEVPFPTGLYPKIIHEIQKEEC